MSSEVARGELTTGAEKGSLQSGAAGGRTAARSKWLRKWLQRLTFFWGLVLLLYCFRAPLLTGLAGLWIVDQPLHKADAIVVLGGGVQRIVEAARLYREGFAPRILVMNVKPNAAVELGVTISEVEVTEKFLLKEGVPLEAVVAVGHNVSSTREEAMAVQTWVETTGARRLVIPTDLFHTRRVKWLFHKTLKNATVDCQVMAVQPREYGPSDWWRHEEGLIFFQNELVKYVFYRVKY